LRRLVLTGLFCVCALPTACGGPAENSGSSGGAQTAPQAPAVPDDIAAVARGALGSEGEALAWGDLAIDGMQQVLVVNRLSRASGAQGEGIVFSRMTIVENDDGNWMQVLLCDEHLKNQHGYLVGAPSEPVTQWKLAFEKDPKKGLILSITPEGQSPGEAVMTLRVRWNPAVKRYQALKPGSELFRGETSSLEPVHRRIG